MRFLRLVAALAALLWFTDSSVPAHATVNSQTNKTVVMGDGHTTQFIFGFIGVAAQYMSVTFTDASGNSTLLTQGAGATQYQITLNPKVTGALWGLGGTVTYNPSGTPIAAGTTLTIERTLPLTQAQSLQNQPSIGVLGTGAETASDTLEMQLQQVDEAVGRAIQANPTNTAPPLPLPPAAQIANLGICADGTGNNLIGCLLAPAGVISSAMQPVVNAGSLALGRTAFGLFNGATNNVGYGLQTGVNAPGGGPQFDVNFHLAQVSTGQSPVAANHLTQYVATGPITFTFPRANTVWNGYGFWVIAFAGNITLSPNVNDSIVLSTGALASGASLTLTPGQQVAIFTDGATSGNWYVMYAGYANQAQQATQTVLLSGSGTYTTPASCLQLRIRMIGGGAGGGGSTSSGGAGGNTTFGSVTANGAAASTGAGGTGGAGSATLRLTGAHGTSGAITNGIIGGVGASSPFGGGGPSGGNAAPNTGAGGGSMVGNGSSTFISGGAGEYVEFVITNPGATFSYAVGAAGAAGIGTGSVGTGGSGLIYVEERY